jgi:23S rRNA (uracil1939-C5)-methyltransferase
MHIAERVKRVIGMEINANSVNLARVTAKASLINNAYFLQGDAAQLFRDIEREKIKVILDPPRKGIDPALAEKIIETGSDMIFYISCYPASLSRDLALFKKQYELSTLIIYDMFPHTIHSETLAIMKKIR